MSDIRPIGLDVTAANALCLSPILRHMKYKGKVQNLALCEVHRAL